MHPIIIALALIVAGWLAMLLTATAIDKPDITVIGMAGLLWLGVLALVWNQWVRKPARWLGRVAAVAVLVMLAATVYAWTQQVDVFVEYRRNCPPRTGTFWKLAGAWLGGVAAINYSLFGSLVAGTVTRRLRDLRNARHLLWWGAIASWSALCTLVFVRNITAEVALRSFKVLGNGTGKAVFFFLVVVGTIAAVVWLVTIPGRKRDKQAKADYLAISEERRREISAIAERHARSVEHCLYYRETGAAGWNIRKAHVGGGVLMPAGEPWPVGDEGEPMLFLLQLPLPDFLPAPWPGRLLGLWLSTSGFDVQVRSYAGVDDLVEKLPPFLPKDAHFTLVSKLDLLPLTLPVPRMQDDEAEGDEFCNQLLQGSAELRAALDSTTAQPGAVLVKILSGDANAHYLESGTGIWVGGEPQLIQNPHDAECGICGQPMRFLFSTGDFTEEMAFGDVGVAYIYGCDVHPQHCQGFVDCH